MEVQRISYFLGTYEDDVRRCLRDLQSHRITERIWERDYTVWKSTPDNIINRLGWLHAPADTLKQLSYVQTVLDPIIAEGYKNAVLLGMGGSCLAAEVFAGIFGRHKGYPRLRILDNTDPAAICRISQDLNLCETLFLVSSKSGTTVETLSLFNYFYNLTVNKLGPRAGRNFIMITDPDSPLEALTYRLSLRHVFMNDPAIGGRYSALSFPGIVPAALIGADVERLLQNAQAAAQNEQLCSSATGSPGPGVRLGATLGALAQNNCDKLVLIFPDKWKSLGNWLEQLIAESTGKEGKGILPVCAAQTPQQSNYGRDHLFVVYDDGADRQKGDIAASLAGRHPVVKISLNDPYEIGSQMFLWEMATAVAGYILDINPFDQPNVEATKIFTNKMVGLYRVKKRLPQEEPSVITAEYCIYGLSGSSAGAALKNFLALAKGGDYVCFQVYLSPAPEIDAQLRQLCSIISAKYRIAATSDYGPRYLHSTGQLHKGDAGRGLFIQLTADDLVDVEIPDNPGSRESTLTFGALKLAQAMGDRQALLQLKRKTIRLHLGANINNNLNSIIKILQ